MSGLPPALRDAALQFRSADPGRQIAEHADALSACYRRGGGSQAAIAEKIDVSAYLTARMPATYAAISTALKAVAARAPEFAPASLLDFGAGPGTASWAAAGMWEGIRSVTMQDRNPVFLEAARVLAEQSTHPALRAAAIAPVTPAGKFELVIAGYVLAELPEAQAGDLALRLWECCAGVLLLVEPGTPAGFRRILRARETLLARGAKMVSPCPANAACPMAGDDWCHFSVRLSRTRDHMRAKHAAVPYEDERYCHAAFGREGIRLAPSAPRIIAPVAETRAGSRFRLCTGDGIAEIAVTRRDRDQYRRHSRKRWGDVF